MHNTGAKEDCRLVRQNRTGIDRLNREFRGTVASLRAAKMEAQMEMTAILRASSTFGG
jgi:hypothetical protein